MNVEKIIKAELLIKLSQSIYDVKGQNQSTTARAFEDLALKCATKAYEILGETGND